jgi:DNA excision repair protein ERCC-2
VTDVKTLKISVSDFADKNHPTGDIDEASGLGQVAPELGAAIHREIQDDRGVAIADYRREVQVNISLEPLGESEEQNPLTLDISGRIDGLWNEDGLIVIEEIKTTLNVRKLMGLLKTDAEHPYLLQLKMYGWMLWRASGNVPELRLLVVAAGSRAESTIVVPFDPQTFGVWVVARQAHLTRLWMEISKYKQQRKTMVKNLRFPFAKKRHGQSDLMADVAEACRSQRQLIAQAPTGLGKTAAVMFPMLKSALRRGDKLFYVTPKNSQLREAERLMASLQGGADAPLGLVMTAKAKICMQAEVRCSPDVCPFAKGHYDKVHRHDLLKKLRQESLINADVLRHYASQFEVCPYELSRQVMPWVDVVAGDYHYALSPQANLRDVARLPLIQDPKPLLAIDEAHNLAERAIDWYSVTVAEMSADLLQLAPKKLRRAMEQVNEWLLDLVQNPGLETKASSRTGVRIVQTMRREDLVERVERWSHEMPLLLENRGQDSEVEALVSAWFSWLSVAELCEGPEELFFGAVDPDAKSLTIHCANAGPLLRETLAKFHAVVAFSATMKPFDYHVTMDGFDPERVQTKEYQSPFPAANRRVIAIPQVSTAYRDRTHHLPKIAAVIDRIIGLRRGNYMAFFPSFELMRKALPLIKAEGFEVLEQPTAAGQQWVSQTLKKLKRHRNILIMAVQGGVLSEGVDLPGEQLIGAFVVGPALAMVTPEREERRRRLAAAGKDGFAHAYVYPAMARSIQSAGRVIRSAKDRGLIVLMDPRFLQGSYRDGLPSDWLDDHGSTEHLISRAILADVQSFWHQSLQGVGR